MGNDVRMTASVIAVLSAFLADPNDERYGLDLMKDTGLASGTLYPILARLERAGWVGAAWEDIDPAVEGRPGRRYYRMTPDGVVSARHELAAIHQRLSRVAGLSGRVSEA